MQSIQKYHNFLINCRLRYIKCIFTSYKISLSCQNKDAASDINVAFGFQNDEITNINQNTQSLNHPFSIRMKDWQTTCWDSLKHVHMYRFHVMYHFCPMWIPCKNHLKTLTKSMQKLRISAIFLMYFDIYIEILNLWQRRAGDWIFHETLIQW